MNPDDLTVYELVRSQICIISTIQSNISSSVSQAKNTDISKHTQRLSQNLEILEKLLELQEKYKQKSDDQEDLPVSTPLVAEIEEENHKGEVDIVTLDEIREYYGNEMESMPYVLEEERPIDVESTQIPPAPAGQNVQAQYTMFEDEWDIDNDIPFAEPKTANKTTIPPIALVDNRISTGTISGRESFSTMYNANPQKYVWGDSWAGPEGAEKKD